LSLQIINDKTPGLDLSEINNTCQDVSGYRLELHEVVFGQMKLKWGRYNTPYEKVVSFYPDKTMVVSHFRISDPGSAGGNKKRRGISEGQFVVYQETAQPYDLCVAPTEGSSFFEASMSATVFDQLFVGESDFLASFSEYCPIQTPSFNFTAFMLPKMYRIIDDMRETSFHGHLKRLFLEAKTIELFLLQIEQLDSRNYAAHAKLKRQDIERLQVIKEYLESNVGKPTSIAALARRAGINSMKLKSGFKELFHTTVFGYLHGIRMREAKRLLLEEGLYVNEVAERVGYKHPHHFSAAFKRQFDITPSSLRQASR
jgi:AraC-like DNA-binding protein